MECIGYALAPAFFTLLWNSIELINDLDDPKTRHEIQNVPSGLGKAHGSGVMRALPRGAYDSRFVGDYEYLSHILRTVRCSGCEDAHHLTCEHCLYHGAFDEPGECIQCPKCSWGYAT